MIISKPGYVLQGPFPTAGSVGARTAANLGQNYHSHSDAEPVGDDFDFAKTIKELDIDVDFAVIGRDQNILRSQQKRIRGGATLPIFLDQYKMVIN